MGGCATKSWAQDEAPPPPLEEPPAGEEEKKVAHGNGSAENRPRSLGYLFKNEDNTRPSETEKSNVDQAVASTKVEKKEELTEPKTAEAGDTEQARKAEFTPGALEESKPHLDEATPQATNKETCAPSMTSEAVVTTVEPLNSESMEGPRSIKAEHVELHGNVENREECASVDEKKLDKDVPLSLSTPSEATQ